MKHWMFRCNDVSQKVSQSMDTALPVHQQMAIWLHIMMCRYCYRFRKQLMVLRKMGRQIESATTDDTSRISLSPEAKERIKKKIDVSS